MRRRRAASMFFTALLCAIAVFALIAPKFTPYSYATQLRELPNSAPSATHLLGTDGLGRDLYSRLVYGTRISLLLAPAAAAISTLIAGIFGALAGLVGGWLEKLLLSIADLSLALPLFFVLLALRAVLPLDVSPVISATATFVLLGLLGWPSALRVLWATSRNLRNSDFVLLARASGCPGWRIVLFQILPNLRPVLFAQFWVAVPVYILTEATLSMLGLGVMEPLPSLGNLLRGLENFSSVSANPWRLAPLVLLMMIVVCFQFILPAREECV